MEGEINNFIVVWITVLTSLCYCHSIGKIIPKGTTRLCAILPIVCLFLYLPLNLTTIHLGSTTAFLIAWMANFKLLLFALGTGPLSSYPPLHLPRFILISCFPINVQNKENTQTRPKSKLSVVVKLVLIAIIIRLYSYEEYVHPKILMILYGVHMYLALELLLATFTALARAIFHLQLEQPFDEPFLSSSLQDFWGKRWNLIVSGILSPTVYVPVRTISTRLIGRKWGPIPAVLATFFVSGLMHELILYYAGRVKPTWEVTCFFLIHGVCLAIEICVKKMLNGKFQLHPMVSGPLVIGFVVVTGIWLFIPPALRCKADVRATNETIAFVNFVTTMFESFKN